MTSVLRIGNCSGFYGDRRSAMKEMLEGGHIDVLTGDYLAELTMLILGRDRAKDPSTGYAKTFLAQLKESLALALDSGVRLVSNAGGANTPALVEAIEALSAEIGRPVKVAHVRGDDLTASAEERGLGSHLAAHAYLGGFGIARALQSGADLVVTGRVTDASLTVGPAAAHFGWSPEDHDQLAGATVAGHILECGTQATGGNNPFFTEFGDQLLQPGFPIAEIHEDGSSVITKHDGTGGAVTVDTVMAQLMYEIGDARYAGPDVTTRLDTVQLDAVGPDRVCISGTKGEPPPPDVKVCLTDVGGYRNEVTVVLTGLDIEKKAELFRRQFEAAYTGKPAEMSWTLARVDQPDAPTQQQASALLTVVARDEDRAVVGRRFSNTAVQLALGTYPGFFSTSPPTDASAYGVHTPGYVPQASVPHEAVTADGTVETIPAPASTAPLVPLHNRDAEIEPAPSGPTTRMALGRVVGARSGDKGGNANIGLWTRDRATFTWLAATMDETTVRELLPEAASLPVHITLLPNLNALNITIEGLLGKGVAHNVRFDPQAKGLAEWLRSRHIDIPTALVPTHDGERGNP